jgi:hypothetical protein
MKLPYGISNFQSLRDQGYLYVDKTPYIERLERLSSKYLFFIRPRRFGKSLFLSMLANYYDVNRRGEFESLFGDLYIGKHPTALRNSYLVLELDFSGLNTDDKAALENSFKRSVLQSILTFLDKYQDLFLEPFPYGLLTDPLPDVKTLLMAVIGVVQKANKPIYLIIDEYDHFANDMIAMGESDLYKGIVRASGFVRDFYETIKIGTKTVIDRIFITGISPIMLDDLTSGFNISENLTTNPLLNEMLGFTGGEVEKMIALLDKDKAIDRAVLMDELRKNYNGYLFNRNVDTRVYNADMILYFFNQWQMLGHFPEQLIDENVKTDYGRLQRLAVNEQNRSQLEEIIKNETVTTNLVSKFSFDRMYDQEYFVSLLFYMGLLTVKGNRYGLTELTIPNYVIKTVFWEYFERRLRNSAGIELNLGELGQAVWEMAYEGKILPFVAFIRDRVLSSLSNRDLIQFDEKYIKLILFCYLNLTNIYRPVSERETDKGYLDIYLEKDFRVPDVRYEWLIELKYVKESDRRQLEDVKREGLKQLERYASSRNLMGNPSVRRILLLFVGKDEIIAEDLPI